MNLSHVADLADLMAALGVIASMVFVGIQIHRNTLESKAAKYQTLAQSAIQWAEYISANDQVAEIHQNGLADYEQLTGISSSGLRCFPGSFGNSYRRYAMTGYYLVKWGIFGVPPHLEERPGHY